MNKQDKISIIVPCFNEEESIPLFFSAVKKLQMKWMPNLNFGL